MKTIAIIPAYNEADHLHRVIETALRYVHMVVVIDDGSENLVTLRDQADKRVLIVRHHVNLGKGAALKTGVLWAQRQGFDVAVFLDGDGQHDPHEMPKLLEPLTTGQADIVFGIREFHGRMPLVARIGNTVLTTVLQLLFHINVQDTQSGYRALRLSVYEKVRWNSPRYAVETEMIVNTGKNHIPFFQVPIATIYHDQYKGTTVMDGIRIMINILAWRII